MAICADCGKRHRRWRNRAHTKPAGYCAKCHNKRMRAVRHRYLENISTLLSVLCPECQALISRKLSGRRAKSKMFHVDSRSHRRINAR